MITDRLRWTVLEANSNEILSRDLNVSDSQVMRNLSAPGKFVLKLKRGEEFKSSKGIDWKTNGQYVVCEIEVDFVRHIFGVGIAGHPTIDPNSGELQIECTGFMGYPKNEPWLENFNPIAVDPFEIVARVWAYLLSFSNANLGVEVYPASSGTQMLPGFGFDGNIFSFDFFAIFIRSTDFTDSMDQITSLSRDIPFDMVEESTWNADRTELTNKIHLSYPFGGVRQENLAFRYGENVKTCEPAEEMDIEPVSDIIIRSWIPGKVYSSTLQNIDPTRFRKTAMEESVHIDSTERAAAWARRKLSRRDIPKSFSKITINPNHPHAPYGSFDVGDTIYVEAPDYPWLGTIQEWHRITSISYSETQGLMELGLMVEGAFNYDPIDFNPDYLDQPTEDLNRLSNGYFADNMSGWTSQQGQWFRVTNVTYDTQIESRAGSVRVDLDDHGEYLLSNRAHCVPGETLKLMAAVRWQGVASTTGAFQLVAIMSLNGTQVGQFVVDEHVNPTGIHAFELLQNNWVVPDGVNEVALQFKCTPEVLGGFCYWTYARVIPG